MYQMTFFFCYCSLFFIINSLACSSYSSRRDLKSWRHAFSPSLSVSYVLSIASNLVCVVPLNEKRERERERERIHIKHWERERLGQKGSGLVSFVPASMNRWWDMSIWIEREPRYLMMMMKLNWLFLFFLCVCRSSTAIDVPLRPHPVPLPHTESRNGPDDVLVSFPFSFSSVMIKTVGMAGLLTPSYSRQD